ncbi:MULTISPECIES: hypothetical protein [Sphingomonas]|uniref:hypothetical protein n=1 Tax=Sphingomonas TaxID=13687 RepID=UPI001402162F|nr:MULTISPECIES: hypothetical protein [Sphingomonas]
MINRFATEVLPSLSKCTELHHRPAPAGQRIARTAPSCAVGNTALAMAHDDWSEF